MYGHSLDGNLLAFFQYSLEADSLPYQVYYATIDEQEYGQLNEIHPRGLLLATRVADMQKVLRAACIMTSHGAGVFQPLRWIAPRVRFVDVWHGAGFKVYHPRHFRSMHHYARCFVASDSWREIYIRERGFRANQVVVTGYARLDQFHRAEEMSRRVRRELGLPSDGHVILYAPTWRRAGEPGEVPFGMTSGQFMAALSRLCERLDAVLVLRAHRNSTTCFDAKGFARIVSVPQTRYLDTNGLLMAVDLLITDWSSVATDFCALDRPVVFMDTPPPRDYASGAAPRPRGGVHAASLAELVAAIETNLGVNPPRICQSQLDMKQFAHGVTLDGQSAARCDRELRRLMDAGK
jgi:CDP-glycerol glycerophosphotransferase